MATAEMENTGLYENTGDKDEGVHIYEIPRGNREMPRCNEMVEIPQPAVRESIVKKKINQGLSKKILFCLALLIIFILIILLALTSSLLSKFSKAKDDSSHKGSMQQSSVGYQAEAGIKQLHDCAAWKSTGHSEDGVYIIYLDDYPFLVYCDMTTDGGGWTVFQKRTNSFVDFYRNWTEYQHFFGEVNGNHWLGLENISYMTRREPQELYVKITDHKSKTYYAKYSAFSVGPETGNYRLTAMGYNGTAGDSLQAHSRAPFSTYDNDHDTKKAGNCASQYHGAWWYTACHEANLNGRYCSSADTNNPRCMVWYKAKDKHESLKSSVMMMRPHNWSQETST